MFDLSYNVPDGPSRAGFCRGQPVTAPATRAFHYAGTALGVACGLYGLATHPWWSLISDVRMAALWATGRLAPQLRRAGVES